jgi:endogenous inhibitor of DNA gyrase (YacG/DUF329 family)
MEARKITCPYCQKEFVTTNKQRVYCSNKCAMAKGYREHLKRKEAKKVSSEFFNFDDYKDGIIV